MPWLLDVAIGRDAAVEEKVAHMRTLYLGFAAAGVSGTLFGVIVGGAYAVMGNGFDLGYAAFLGLAWVTLFGVPMATPPVQNLVARRLRRQT